MCYRQVRCLIRILAPEKIFYLSASPSVTVGGQGRGSRGGCDKGVKAKLIHTGEIKRIAGLLSGSCQIPGRSSLIECAILESCLLLGEDGDQTGIRERKGRREKQVPLNSPGTESTSSLPAVKQGLG